MARHDTRAGGVTVKVPLPGPSTDAIMTFTVKGKATGPVVPVTANDRTLGNESVVYVVKGPKKGALSGAWTIYALIKRFATYRAVAGHRTSADQDLVVVIKELTGNPVGRYVVKDEKGNCPLLDDLNGEFEHQLKAMDVDGQISELIPGRRSSVQSSSPEEVLDQIVIDNWGSNCPGQAEAWDRGPG